MFATKGVKVEYSSDGDVIGWASSGPGNESFRTCLEIFQDNGKNAQCNFFMAQIRVLDIFEKFIMSVFAQASSMLKIKFLFCFWTF